MNNQSNDEEAINLFNKFFEFFEICKTNPNMQDTKTAIDIFNYYYKKADYQTQGEYHRLVAEFMNAD